tara:strand:+ start:16 stop:162 length:147 start_codon:yes stop_codon:yes gene_type:complete
VVEEEVELVEVQMVLVMLVVPVVEVEVVDRRIHKEQVVTNHHKILVFL